MANMINTNYSLYQKNFGNVGGKRNVGKKEGPDGKKPPANFGADFGVELSGEGLAALEAQQQGFRVNQKEDGGDDFLTEDKLCIIQKTYGEKFLSQTCSSYPRRLFRFGEVIEKSLSPTCPLAAELILNPERIAAMAEGLRQTAKLPDPLGREDFHVTRPNGLKIRRVHVPFGVVGIICKLNSS